MPCASSPKMPTAFEVAAGRAYLAKKDIFRNLMWYSLPDSNKQYPLTIERVKKIKELNKQGVRPDSLEPVEVVSNKPKEVEPVYADVVGQISLKALEKTSRKRREQEKRQNQPRGRQGGNSSQQAPKQQGGGQQQPRQQGGSNQPNRGGGRPQQQGGGQQNRDRRGGGGNNPNRQGQNRNPQRGQNPGNRGGDKK